MDERRRKTAGSPDEKAVSSSATEEAAGLKETEDLTQEGRHSEDEVRILQAQVADLIKEKDALKAFCQRTLADFMNYKRRSETEREDTRTQAKVNAVGAMLPLLDDLKHVVDNADESIKNNAWFEGVTLIYRKFCSVLESEHVVCIEAAGNQFNPFCHESFGFRETADRQEGEVVEVVRDGYTMQGRVIRPALVILAKKPHTPEV